LYKLSKSEKKKEYMIGKRREEIYKARKSKLLKTTWRKWSLWKREKN